MRIFQLHEDSHTCSALSGRLRRRSRNGHQLTVLGNRPAAGRRFEVSQVTALRWLVRQCLRNPAGSFSVHRLTQDLKSQGHGVARDAVNAMFSHLTDAFLLSTVPLATDSERQRNSNPRKIYPADPGLIPAFDASGRVNLGHSLETAVLNELNRRRAETGYLRTAEGLEVDFLVRNRDADHELIQVCARTCNHPKRLPASYVRSPLPVRSIHVRGLNYSYLIGTRPGKSRRQA